MNFYKADFNQLLIGGLIAGILGLFVYAGWIWGSCTLQNRVTERVSECFSGCLFLEQEEMCGNFCVPHVEGVSDENISFLQD